jgi:hypothetical protein
MDKLVDNFVNSMCVKYAAEAEQMAKADAPWEDRTGTARRLLKGVVIDGKTDTVLDIEGDDGKGGFKNVGTVTVAAENSIGFALAHRVEYGAYLETANDGRYAVLRPTVDK